MTYSIPELKQFASVVLSHSPSITTKQANKPSDIIVPVHHAMMDIYDNDDMDLSLDIAKVIFYGY